VRIIVEIVAKDNGVTIAARDYTFSSSDKFSSRRRRALTELCKQRE
jgi:hypothetical protein